MKIKCLRNDVDDFLEIGKEYTVLECLVYTYSSYFVLEGVSRDVNTVQFDTSINEIPRNLIKEAYVLTRPKKEADVLTESQKHKGSHE